MSARSEAQRSTAAANSRVKFRHNASITVAAVVAFFGAIPVATYRWYLAPLLLVPLLVAVWGWRAGTDAGPDGLTVRALAGSRRVSWQRVAELVPVDRRVVARLTDGSSLTLTAVPPSELGRLVAASGHQPTRDSDDPEAETEADPSTPR
ncbi:MAG TPA: PH domain-containing protein [Micromonosporaceae bacterium]